MAALDGVDYSGAKVSVELHTIGSRASGTRAMVRLRAIELKASGTRSSVHQLRWD